MLINIIGKPTASLPIHIRDTMISRVHNGKADPIWSTKFTTKFSKKPKATEELVQPKGALNVIDRFVDKAAELDYLINTQHLELATTRSLLGANGIATMSISNMADDADIEENEPVGTEYDPTATALMARRIEWEKFIFSSGPIHTAKFAPTKQGTLGIDYIGAKKFATAEATLATRRALKEAWLDRVGPLPTVDEINERRAFCEYYGNKPVLAYMTEEERDAHTKSRMYGIEDEDPGREYFHAQNPRTAVLTEMVTFDEEGTPEYSMVTDDLPGGIIDVGYAGPRGLLGIDDEHDEPSSDWGYPEYPTESED